MPELQHYTTFDEALTILRELMQQGLLVIPEQPVLNEPRLQRYEQYTSEIVDRLRSYRCMLLEGPFTKHALQFDRRTSGTAAGTYYADQSSGPRVRWCISGVNTTNRPTLTPGSVSYSRSYLNPTSNQWEDASEELKAAFKRIVEIFKRHLVKVPCSSGERVWVGRAAKQAIERGEFVIDR